MPNGLTRIEADAFQGVAAVSVVIPRSLNSIIGNPCAGSEVRYIYAYGTWLKTWAERNGYTYVQMD